MDKKRILSLLALLDEYSEQLKGHLLLSYKEYSANLEKQRFAERTLQLLIEICIDVGYIIVKELKIGLPDDEESVFDKLKEKSIVSEEMYEKLRGMKRFRNVLIHRYKTINNYIVYENATKNRGDFTEFKKEILSFLREWERTEKKKKTKKKKGKQERLSDYSGALTRERNMLR